MKRPSLPPSRVDWPHLFAVWHAAFTASGGAFPDPLLYTADIHIDDADNNSAWPAMALGQTNPQTTSTDGVFAVMMSGGPNCIKVTRGGYQPDRSPVFDERSAVPSVALTPAISAAPTHRVYITEAGFEPAMLHVPADSVVGRT